MSQYLPLSFVLFALLAFTFFGVRLVTDPARWPVHAIGAVVSLFVLARNARIVWLIWKRGRRAAPARSPSSTPLSLDAPGASKPLSSSPEPRTPSTLRVTSPSFREIDDEATLDQALSGDRVVIYKHSTRCVVSTVVVDEVLRFAETHPDWTVYRLKVIERRDLSNAVAERLGVRHHSPQVFMIREGRSVWNASHGDITAENLARHARAGGGANAIA